MYHTLNLLTLLLTTRKIRLCHFEIVFLSFAFFILLLRLILCSNTHAHGWTYTHRADLQRKVKRNVSISAIHHLSTLLPLCQHTPWWLPVGYFVTSSLWKLPVNDNVNQFTIRSLLFMKNLPAHFTDFLTAYLYINLPIYHIYASIIHFHFLWMSRFLDLAYLYSWVFQT